MMTVGTITFGMLFAVAALLVWAAASDIRSFEIPNWIPVTIIGLYIAYVIIRNLIYPEFGAVAWLPALGAAAMVLFVFTVWTPRACGSGSPYDDLRISAPQKLN